jgi:hypothetical protein
MSIHYSTYLCASLNEVSHNMMFMLEIRPCEIVWWLQISKRTKLATPGSTNSP